MNNDQKALHGEAYTQRFEQFRSLQLKRLRGILKNISFNKTDVVADFGCGNGLLFEFIYDKINKYYGIDFSESLLNLFRKRNADKIAATGAILFEGDIIEFCKQHTKEIDKAFTLDFSEHITDEDFVQIYTAITSSLKPDGVLYLHTPNLDFFVEKLKDKGIMKQFPEHIGVRNAKQYQRLLKIAGFNRVKVKHIPHYNWLKFLHIFSFIPLLGKYFKARIFLKCYV